ncbi:MAG: quinolinate synthase NadA [Candidatus Methanomethylophilaceae archaeon]|nr:quinolinate synthase NadA [Candidatus Methanomethylophilaceae archaeon]
MHSVAEKVAALKKERNAIILAHNYTSPEVQDLADHVGDSLGLSKIAAGTDADVIVFCGVSFMGETAKVLCPSKTVLLPEPDAHCAMASMCSADEIRRLKAEHPGYIVVGYVNSTAEAKTEMDYCCTSSNAVPVVRSLGTDKVIFVPDANLGAYVASKIHRDIVLWDGYCPIHQCITVKQVADMKARYPGAVVLAHPECRPEVLDMADYIGSTEKIVSVAEECPAETFIVLTEVGLLHKLEKRCPGKRFHFPPYAICTTMKMIEPESVLGALQGEGNEVILAEETIRRAYVPVKRMTDITE